MKYQYKKMETNKKFDHIMVDIETLGSESNSAILSIGAVKFDINTGEVGDTFYKTISLDSCLKVGLTINADTIAWWMNNSTESQKALFLNTNLLICVLDDLSQFITKEDQVWGNSARFDLGLLQNAYNKVNLPIPWDFRKERCLRTLVSFNPDVKEHHNFTNTKHNALDDCYNQIQYAVKIWNSFEKKPQQSSFNILAPNSITNSGLKVKCSCPCHRQNGIVHVAACCNNGYL